MTHWRKSSRSSGDNGGMSDCVEVAALQRVIGVRDSKNPAAVHLALTSEAFADLLARLKDGASG